MLPDMAASISASLGFGLFARQLTARRTGRTCCGMELDPLYVDTIIRRWQAYAGEIARHRERAKFCRARRGTWKAGMTKPCYDVGYGKPPLHTRFRKGQSGNPKGRSKGTKNFATIFMRAMSQSVTIIENGKRKKISKIAAAVTQLANDAARGDKKSIQLTFAWLQTLEPRIEAQETKEVLIYSGVLADSDRTL
jgi:hypothetical protein